MKESPLLECYDEDDPRPVVGVYKNPNGFIVRTGQYPPGKVLLATACEITAREYADSFNQFIMSAAYLRVPVYDLLDWKWLVAGAAVGRDQPCFRRDRCSCPKAQTPDHPDQHQRRET